MKTLMKKLIKKVKGFTLLEILLVIGIVAALAGIVILAINPSKTLATVRNSERKSDLKQIDSALSQYYIDNNEYPASLTSVSSLTEICDTGTATSGHTILCNDLVDLSILVPTYLTAIPTDPSATTTTYAGYKIVRTGRRISLSAPGELGVTITIGDVPTVWSCGSAITDSRDSKIYNTVLIGSQCWMQQNLNVGTKITSCTNGYVSANSPCVSGGDTTHNQGTSLTTIEKYCHNDNEANCTTYGGFYQWNQMMGGSTTPGITGICPAGWHVPTDTEYKTLEVALGMCTGTGINPNYCANDSYRWRGTTQGDQLKNAGLCQGRTPCSTSNFQVLLAGSRYTDGFFYNFGGYTYLWSSSQSGTLAWARFLGLTNSSVYRYTEGKAYGLSVRCLKD